jgi:hypothetical protein
MAVSLIVCNLLPVVICLYKGLRSKDLDLSLRRHPTDSMFLTTIVDLPSSDDYAIEEFKSIT